MLLALALAAPAICQSPSDLDAYDLVWSTPGGDAAGSVPMGNGALGLNAWVEPGGDLLLLLARNDSFSEASRLLKVGRVRIALDPPLATGEGFRQTLHLREGRLLLEFDGGQVEVFLEPGQDRVRVGGSFTAPRGVRASTEIWRNERRRLLGDELASSWTMRAAPDAVEVWESADQLADLGDAVGWFHHNETSVVPFSFRHQGMPGLEGLVGDPLIHLTFGAVLAGPGFRKADAHTLASRAPARAFDLRIAAPAPAQSSVVDSSDWVQGAAAMAATAPSWNEARAQAAAHWEEFWNRSWIFVRGDPAPFKIPFPAEGEDREVRLGVDSNGQNRWEGEFARARVHVPGLTDDALRSLPGEREDQIVREAVIVDGRGDAGASTFVLEAWLRRPPSGAPARILDWITVGGSDGFLFDTHPGRDLRFIVGTRTLIAPGAWPDDGEWHHVAASYDESRGAMSLWRDGEQVAATAAADPAPPSLVTRAYVLQRWVSACAGRGSFPIKFNGSIFTVEPAAAGGQPWNPDWRRWGDCYWWQNTRLPYYPMLAAGDFDLMDGLFDFYARIIPACRARTKAYTGARGAYFPETVTMFGAYSNGDYGWDREGHEASEVLCPWWQWAWNQGLELVDLMLLRTAYTGDDAFARDQLLPMAREVLTYFDTRFPRDESGILSITPTQALETHWHGVVNDMPCVAGLRSVLPRLLALPEVWTSAEDRALWQRLSAALPPLPVREVEGARLFSPAERYDPSRQNVETPELHATFPFRLAAVGGSDGSLALAREAYARRHDRQSNGWTQDGILAARLGLTDEAQANLLARVANSHPKYRFPATWGPNFDWLPDQCHGSNLMLGLQEMLMQTDGDQILLFPAWPKEWDVSFKLHAPRDTIVEGRLLNGKVVELVVTPESRRVDLQILLQ